MMTSDTIVLHDFEAPQMPLRFIKPEDFIPSFLLIHTSLVIRVAEGSVLPLSRKHPGQAASPVQTHKRLYPGAI